MDNQLKQAKELKSWMKYEWEDLWTNKHKDEIKAEGISTKTYKLLDVERGEIIHATRDYKPLSFRELLEKQIPKEYTERIDIDPTTGGYRKFAKQHFPPKKKTTKREKPSIKHDLDQHQRKNGAGWKNQFRINRKRKENARA